MSRFVVPDRAKSFTEEWTYYLLSLGLPTILDITSPRSPTSASFAHACARGYTNWPVPTAGSSRSTFLKEAVSRVYEERMMQRHPSIIASHTAKADSLVSQDVSDPVQASHHRCVVHAAEIRARRDDPAFKDLPLSSERPISNFSIVLSKLENNASAVASLSSGPRPVQVAARETVSKTSSRKASPVPAVPLGPQVRDPVDVAVERLVSMGFEECKAKRALAETDSGNSIEFDKAMELLVRERKRAPRNCHVPAAKDGVLVGGAARYA